ncbi:MAG: hypothetical protein U1E05_09330, partial [Patescibacteria group bacterium]|nr:hypothetical protein [Patescibacteria group bacterium]
MSILPDSPHLTDHADATVDDYRAVSGWAVTALVLGLLAPLALVEIWLSLIPVLGISLAMIALVRIAVLAPAMTGRTAALAGLFLSVLSLSAAGANHVVYWRAMDHEARRFAEAWFGFLAREEVYQAYQLTLAPRQRQPEPADDAPPAPKPSNAEGPREFGLMEEGPEGYHKHADVRVLLA